MANLRCILFAVFICTFTFMYHISAAQTREPYVRIAKIVVDSTQLENYKAALKEGIETAVRVEPGVLRMYAVYDKDKPTHITVFETYASKEAYESHIQIPHFKKYKTGTLSMVKSLELVDVIPIAFEAKKQQ
jgi:quinol monooxygenase YgiN